MQNRKLTFNAIGCDPEMFFVERATGKPFSAEGIVPGTKDEPYFISNKGHMIQLDNVLVEFGIPPSKSLLEFKENINFVLKYIKDTYGDRFDIGTMASADMDESQLQSEHACLFGCDPDFSAWTMDQNPKPQPSGNLRSAGGHIHISVNEEFELDDVFRFIKLCDLTLGLPSILIDPDERRKQLYGKAGAFRFKHYFGEYRTLSNFWIHSEEKMELVYNQLQKAFDFFNDSDSDLIMKEFGNDIVHAINNNDKSMADMLVKKFNIL